MDHKNLPHLPAHNFPQHFTAFATLIPALLTQEINRVDRILAFAELSPCSEESCPGKGMVCDLNRRPYCFFHFEARRG